MKRYFTILSALLILGSCSKDVVTAEEQLAIDIKLIEDYLKSKNITAEKTIDGVYYVIENPGGEVKPKITNTLTVTYKGYFLDGIIFDSGEKAVFPLSVTIQGWQIGMPKFGKGGKGKLFIPSKWAYGASAQPGRSNAVLAFDIEVFDF